jgi:hypothetical protein
MNVHKNAPLTPKGREAMARSVVEGAYFGDGGRTAAPSRRGLPFQLDTETVAKCVKRFREGGVDGLRDRS